MSLLTTMSVIGIPSSAQAENLQGNAKGFITRTISLSQNGAPLLQSFYFRYKDDDHEYAGMEVRPNLPAVNQASLGFADKNSDDQYFYNVTVAPYFGEIVRHTTTEFSRGGHVTVPAQAPANPAEYVFVIRGFYLQYRGDDHEVEEIGIQESNGKITVTLNDKNDDDPFRVDLDYAYVPRARFAELKETVGRAKGGQRVNIATGTAVTRGFHFKFRNSDHELKEFGVVLNGTGRLEVFFSDKNQDDPFDWSVTYGVFKP